jgi:hypothetical protein
MGEEGCLLAARFFKGIGQGREAVEGSFLVDLLGQPHESAPVPCQPSVKLFFPLLPSSFRRQRVKWITEDATEEGRLLLIGLGFCINPSGPGGTT